MGGRGIVQSDPYPEEEGKGGPADTSVQRDGPAKTEPGDSRWQAQQNPQGNQPCQHLELGLRAPEPRENGFLLFEPPSLWYSAMVALANAYSGDRSSSWGLSGPGSFSAVAHGRPPSRCGPSTSPDPRWPLRGPSVQVFPTCQNDAGLPSYPSPHIVLLYS